MVAGGIGGGAAVIPCYRQLSQQYQHCTGRELGTRLLLVSIASQTLQLFVNGELAAQYPVSTARNGVGCDDGSGCTPLGWHQISEKIGAGSPLGSLFRGRVATGEVADNLCSDACDDLITSRILWLRGLETGINCGAGVDSHARYIYLHGTAQEHLIGRPVSHGCIRLRNHNVIQLFDRVYTGAAVCIVES